MRYIQCPNEFVGNVGVERSIFLAGGITGCPNWQADVVRRFEHCQNRANGVPEYILEKMKFAVLVNPRRENWVDGDIIPEDQIEWEFRHLNLVDEIYFWFPKEGQCMITLFELGWALGANKRIRVAVEPGYVREVDVREQVRLRAPWIIVGNSVSDLFSNWF